ncbi:MAG TPA: hypothetical protein VM452_10870 [Caulifigura sp.]|nr:hypothetical protein [Caulifigura sp.]
MRRRMLLCLAGAAVAVSLGGCGGPAPVKLAPVEAVVKINGQPAADILVQFLPDVSSAEPAVTATGTTDASGKAVLMASNGQPGAMVGTNKVVLADLNEERPPQGKPLTRKPRLPSHYMVLGAQSPEVLVRQDGNTPFEIAIQ